MKPSRNVISVVALILVAHLLSGCGGAEQRKLKYVEKGKAYFAENNYAKAKIELRNALQIDPKYAEAYFLLGQVEESRQYWQPAFANYSKAIELNPDHFDARAQLGRLYLLAGELDKSTEMMQTILAKDPGNFKARMLKAAILSRKGDSKAAIKEVTEVVDGNATLIEAVDMLASLHTGNRYTENATAVLTKGIETNPKIL